MENNNEYIKRKIAVLEAMEKGKTIQYSETDGEENDWEDLKTSELDFSDYTYRVKPDKTTKFNKGDTLVFIGVAEAPNPIRYKVTEIKNNYYEFDCISPRPIEEVNENFINERDVLWYFEIYDYVYKKFSMHPSRLTIPEMDKAFGANHDTLSWKPMYNLGFRLKEDN